MDHNQKLAFISNMTDKTLQHIAMTPNVAAPDGKMSHDKMMTFVGHNMKLGLQAFATGGIPITETGGIGGAANQFLTNNQFQAGAVPVQPGTNPAEVNQAYNGTQSALRTQGNVTNTLNGQLSQGAGQQSQLANMYLNQANGQGPNPAQAALNQNTGQNIAQQAALAASTRGAGANAGLIASQNAAQGAATQQQAVGQAATQQAAQQLAAEQNLQNLSANQVAQGTTATQGLNNAQQNEQNILQGANTAANSANVAQQSNINNVNAGIAEANQNASGSAVGGILGGIAGLGEALFAYKGGIVKMDKGGKVLDANARKHIAPHNFALPGGRYPIHDIAHARNALARVSQNGTADEKSKVRAAVAKKYPGIMQSKGEEKKMACGGMAYAKGGMIKPAEWSSPFMKMAGGGTASIQGEATSGPTSYVGNWLNNTVSQSQLPSGEGGIPLTTAGSYSTNSASGQAIGDALFSPSASASDTASQASLSAPTPSAAAAPFNGFGADLTSGNQASIDPTNITAEGAMNYEGGGKVAAENSNEMAVKKGDSLDNDKVPALLSQGEIVIPRHITMGPNAPAHAAAFVARELAKRKGK